MFHVYGLEVLSLLKCQYFQKPFVDFSTIPIKIPVAFFLQKFFLKVLKFLRTAKDP